MKEFLNAMDNLPLVLKVIIAIFVDVVWHIYRIIKSLDTKNTTSLIISIVLCFIPFMALIDLIMLLVKGNVLYLEV